MRLPDTRTIKAGLGERLSDRSIVTRDNCEVIIHWDESWGNRRRLICLEFIESQPPEVPVGVVMDGAVYGVQPMAGEMNELIKALSEPFERTGCLRQ